MGTEKRASARHAQLSSFLRLIIMLDYLDWDSTLSLERVFASTQFFSHGDYTSSGDCLYLGAVKEEKNRTVVMLHDGEHEVCLTPKPFHLQTRVNEYGGKPYWVCRDSLIFANQADQCLYRQLVKDSKASEPVRISPKPSESERFMYTDVHELGDGVYIAIVEREESVGENENAMFIGLISRDSDAPVTKLIDGSDFYSNLVFCSKNNRVAWVQWQHPGMPWDETQLWVAELGDDYQLLEGSIRQIALANDDSTEPCVCQLLFAGNGRLFFSVDFKGFSINSDISDNYWGLHSYDFGTTKLSKIDMGVGQEGVEFGYPHWVYGDARIVQLDQHQLLMVGSHPEGDQLFIVNQNSYDVTVLGERNATLQHLASNRAGKCVLTCLNNDRPPRLLELEFSEQSNKIKQQRIVVDADPIDFDASIAEHISFPTRDGDHAYGFYYRPINQQYQNRTAPELNPPLIVMVHGGPTARAYGHFDLQKQFWTSRGFAIFDVNHRGSSGYGRQFRDALYGQWGEVDASDIIDGIDYLTGCGKADSERICIRGKSAGGYAVLRALTEYPSVFKAGACYYGIGNLVTLAEATHKFEKHYTDRLIDEVFDLTSAVSTSSKFYQRSPINKIDQVDSAMIIFQGSLDKVVPPSVALEVVCALKASKLEHDYTEYDDEAHGFRQIDNNIDALTKELAFYRRVLAQ